MRKRIEAGIWEIFVPGVVESAHYKYEVRNCFGNVVLKSDPFSFFGQHGVQTASLVFNLDRFKWSDAAWIEERIDLSARTLSSCYFGCCCEHFRHKTPSARKP